MEVSIALCIQGFLWVAWELSGSCLGAVWSCVGVVLELRGAVWSCLGAVLGAAWELSGSCLGAGWSCVGFGVQSELNKQILEPPGASY